MGLLPAIGKLLEINGRLRRYVVQDYRKSVTVGKDEFLSFHLVVVLVNCQLAVGHMKANRG